jgi:30S ribosomal protein S31
MGKGDQRTRRGKLCRGTFGKTRPQRVAKTKKAAPAKAAKPKA